MSLWKFIMRSRLGPLVLPPEGMIRPIQGLRLSAISYLLGSDSLEIGSWVGRSTSYIAAGLRIAGSSAKLYSVDKHFSSQIEYEKFFKEDLNKSCERGRRYLRHLERDEGTLTSLRENLDERCLRSWVNIISGDILELNFDKKFKFVFADVVHDKSELERNLEKILSLLDNDSVLVCDDFRHPDMFPYLKKNLDYNSLYLDKYMAFISTGSFSCSVLRKVCFGCNKLT